MAGVPDGLYRAGGRAIQAPQRLQLRADGIPSALPTTTSRADLDGIVVDAGSDYVASLKQGAGRAVDAPERRTVHQPPADPALPSAQPQQCLCRPGGLTWTATSQRRQVLRAAARRQARIRPQDDGHTARPRPIGHARPPLWQALMRYVPPATGEIRSRHTTQATSPSRWRGFAARPRCSISSTRRYLPAPGPSSQDLTRARFQILTGAAYVRHAADQRIARCSGLRRRPPTTQHRRAGARRCRRWSRAGGGRAAMRAWSTRSTLLFDERLGAPPSRRWCACSTASPPPINETASRPRQSLVLLALASPRFADPAVSPHRYPRDQPRLPPPADAARSTASPRHYFRNSKLLRPGDGSRTCRATITGR